MNFKRNNPQYHVSMFAKVSYGSVLLLFLVLFAWYTPKANAISQAENPDRILAKEQTNAVFFSPEIQTLVQDDQLRNNQIQIVTSYESLKDYVVDNPDLSIIYLHLHTIDQIEPSFLQEQYELGRIIGVFEAPISYLKMLISVDPTFPSGMEDIAWEPPANTKLLFSLYQSLNNSQTKAEGYRAISSYFFDFEEIHSMVKALTQKSNPQEELIDPSPAETSFLMATSDIWTDSTGGSLYGWSYTSKDGGGFYWGHGYSDYLTSAPYFQQVYVETYNNCGGWHKISDVFLKHEYTTPATQVYTLMGSSQCGNSFGTYATHASQRYPSYSTYVSGNTSATCTGSNC